MESRNLADIADIITGTSPGKRASVDLALFIQIKDLDESKRALVSGPRPTAKRATPAQAGDVLLAARGGQAIVAGHGNGEGLPGAYPTLDVYLIRPRAARLDSSYLAAWLNLPRVRHQLQASTTGSLIPRIPIASLKALPLALPPLPRQRALGELFQLAHAEAVAMERLHAQTRHLREGQLASAFALLETTP